MSVLCKFDPTMEFHKSIIGAVAENTKFALRLQIADFVHPTKVVAVVFNEDGDNFVYDMFWDASGDGFDNYVTTIQLKKGLYWYYFKMEGVPFEEYIGINDNCQAEFVHSDVKAWQLSVYKKKYNSPNWLGDGIMYHIMVDRFNNVGKVVATEDKIMRKWGEQPYFQEADGSVTNRDFFGGNLAGIIEKLPYLKSLNVKTIFLSPIFKAYSNHKYDTEDYEVVDSMFGTNADFEKLCKEAKKLDMNVILDGVFNHVGSGSKYFNKDKKFGDGGAYHDKKSPYRDWFNFYDKYNYECWWNFETLPRINAHSKSAQKYFTGENGIVPMWIKKGASGWRLDVVDEIDDVMLDKIVSSAKLANPDAVVLGEVWEDASNKIDYGVRRRFFEGEQLDTVMNYPLRRAIIEFVRDGNTELMKSTVFHTINNYPLHVRNNLMNLLGTHDTIRILTTLTGDRLENTSREVMSKVHLRESQYLKGIELLKLCAILQYTMFGFPSVYYGDEVGMEGYRDPFCRGCYPWGLENQTLLAFYRQLGEMRKLNVFKEGSFKLLVAKNRVFAFERQDIDTREKVVVGINRGEYSYTLQLGTNYRDLLTGRKYKDFVDLQPDQAVVLIRVENGKLKK